MAGEEETMSESEERAASEDTFSMVMPGGVRPDGRAYFIKMNRTGDVYAVLTEEQAAQLQRIEEKLDRLLDIDAVERGR